jgi:predicted membrane-bound mannosyltransferase
MRNAGSTSANLARHRLGLLLLVLLLGAGLRLWQLGRSPLRGDEAFSARYWTLPYDQLVARPGGLAWVEPHPIGTFLLFHHWRNAVGTSEIALRALPALINLLGVAALYALGKKLVSEQAGLWAALFWAVNPYLIWHSQDLRNYALWVGFSALALALLTRIVTLPKASPALWLAYLLAIVAAQQSFFVEFVFIGLHGLWVLLCYRHLFARWLLVWIIFAGFSAITLAEQAISLAGSGYSGTRDNFLAVGLPAASSRVLGSLLYNWGDTSPSLPAAIGLLAVLIGLLAALWRAATRPALLLGLLWLFVPYLALLVASSRLNVFDPRYLMASSIALALIAGALGDRAMRGRHKWPWALVIALLSLNLLAGLVAYHRDGPNKAPDWFSLRAYLSAQAQAADTIIILAENSSGAIDPAYAYYYAGPAKLLVLPYPQADTDTFVRAALADGRVWLVAPQGANAEPVLTALAKFGQQQDNRAVGAGFRVWRWVGLAPNP